MPTSAGRVLGYAGRRLATTLVLIVGVVAVTLVLVHLAPGDASQTLAGQGGDPRYLAELRHRLGLDRPLAIQIVVYLTRVFRGDLGFSLIQGQPVLSVILARLPASLVLAGGALLLGATAGMVLGGLAARHERTRLDAGISIGALIAFSLPVFWVGQLAIGLFAVQLHWLPAAGMTSVQPRSGWLSPTVDLLRHLVLPACTLAMLISVPIIRTARAAMVEALHQDYVAVARAKGMTEPAIIVRHVLRNALAPVVTVLTGQASLLVTGTALVEVVYSWPGLGQLLFNSVLARDTPVLLGVLMVSSLAVAVANLIGDLAHLAIDPRVRP